MQCSTGTLREAVQSTNQRRSRNCNAAASEKRGDDMLRSAARWACLALAAFVATPCLADTVSLDNGDRLTGNIVRLEGGKLLLNTKYAGDIKIDLGRIRNLQSEGPMTVVLGTDQRFYGKLTGDGAEITIQPTDHGEARQE